MVTILWCYSRNNEFLKDNVDYNSAADIAGQANYLGVSLQVDIIKQKSPTSKVGFTAIGFAETDPLTYTKLSSDDTIDLCRCQVLNCYVGRLAMLNTGGESKGESNFKQARKTAVVNKRTGGSGIIMRHKLFSVLLTIE
jgi:class I fructose-bisphosphate aldolase